MLGSARSLEVPELEQGIEVREPWDGRREGTERPGSVSRVEYLQGIGWVSRDPWPQREKRSPR